MSCTARTFVGAGQGRRLGSIRSGASEARWCGLLAYLDPHSSVAFPLPPRPEPLAL